MFTLEEINDIHDRLGEAETLPQYLEALKNIGVDKYDSFITDGHSEYFGKGDYKIVSPLSVTPAPTAGVVLRGGRSPRRLRSVPVGSNLKAQFTHKIP